MDELLKLYEKASTVRGKVSEADLDAWVARETGGLVPSYAQLAQMTQGEKVSKLGAFGRGALRGATFDFADELAGAGAALVPGGRGYTEARDAARADFANAEQQHRGLTMAGQFAGGFAVPGLGTAGAAARTGAGLLKSAVAGGAVAGALQGTGASEAETLGGVATDAAVGAGIGGVAAPLALPVVAALKFAVGRLGRIFDPQGAITAEARQLLTQVLRQAGMTVGQVEEELAKLQASTGGQAVAADALGPVGGRQLRASLDAAPGMENQIQRTLERRQRGQSERVASAVEEGFGITGAGARETRRATKEAVRPLAERVYGPLDNQSVVSPEINQILSNPDVADVAARVRPRGTMAPLAPADEVARVMMTAPDGVTVDPRTGQKITSGGTVVSVVSDRAGVEAVTPDVIAGYQQRYAQQLANDPTLALGSWRSPSTGRFHVDLVKIAPREEAVQLGQRLRQEGVYDLDAGEFIGTGGSASTAQDAPPVLFQRLQSVIRRLEDAKNVAFRSGAGNEGDEWAAAARALSKATDEALPGYRAADQVYRGAKAVEGAFKLGAKATQLPYAEVRAEVGQLVARGGTEALDAYRMGFVESLTTKLRRTPTSKDVSSMFAHMGPDMEQTYRLLFPRPQDFEKFMAAVSAESAMARTARAVRGGPNTAQRIADQSRPTAAAMQSLRSGGGVTGALSNAAEAAFGGMNRGQNDAARAQVAQMLMQQTTQGWAQPLRQRLLSGLMPGVAPGVTGGLMGMFNQE